MCGLIVGMRFSPQYDALVMLPPTYSSAPLTPMSSVLVRSVIVVRASAMPAIPGVSGALEKVSYGVFGASGEPARATSGPICPGPDVF